MFFFQNGVVFFPACCDKRSERTKKNLDIFESHSRKSSVEEQFLKKNDKKTKKKMKKVSKVFFLIFAENF